MLVKGNDISRENIRNILLIQLGDIGDVVWATPTFRAVKETYPRTNVSVLLREGFGSLLEADPSVHRIFEVKRYRGNLIKKMKKQIRFLRTLRQECFDLVFDLRSDDRGAFMAFLSGAPIRASIVYHYIPWRNKLFTHLADPPPVDKTVCSAAEQSLRVVREFGVDSQDDVPKLCVSEEIHNRVKQLFDKEGIDDNRIITLNPFSRWKYKEWGYGKWVEIVDWLWEEYEIATVIIGAIEEKEQSEYMVQRCCGRVFNLTGKTTLGELTGVLNHSYLHLGVDSAAPHIAAAVGIPTITIYGPSDWRDWAPQGNMHRVVIPDRVCAPCQQKGCDGNGISKCLEELKVNKLKEIIRESLNNCLHKTDIE
jgi:heptosyltransferase-3